MTCLLNCEQKKSFASFSKPSGTRYNLSTPHFVKNESIYGPGNLLSASNSKLVSSIIVEHTFLVTEDWNHMMMQLQGKSLDVIFTEGGNQLDLGTVMSIGMKMIDGLETDSSVWGYPSRHQAK